MSENTFNMVYDYQVSDENYNLINDLNECQKKIEFLESYRKFFIKFSDQCVCRQTSVLKSVVKSLERQYREKFLNSEQQTDSYSSDESPETFVENTSEAVEEVIIRTEDFGDNSETVDEPEDQTNQVNDNFVLVFNKQTKSLVKKSSDNIDTTTEMIINKVVIKTPEESVSNPIVIKNNPKKSLILNEDNPELRQRKTKTYSKTDPTVVIQQNVEYPVDSTLYQKTRDYIKSANTSNDNKQQRIQSKNNLLKHMKDKNDEQSSWILSDEYKHNNKVMNSLIEDLKTGKIESFVDPNYSLVSVFLLKDDSTENQTIIYKCTETDCQFVGHDRHSARRHVQRHNPNKSFVCKICDKSFTVISYLRQHLQIVHNIDGKPKIKCDFPGCNYKALHKSHLKAHYLYHSDQKTVKCEHIGCDTYFKTHNLMRSHMKIHSDVREYSCDWPECGARFKSKAYVRRHLETHTRSGSSISKLKDVLQTGNYVSTVDTKSPNNSFSVIRSQKTSERNGKLEIGQKLGFKCNLIGCKFATTYRSIITQHVSTHLFGKTLECSLCAKKFGLKRYLQQHMKTVHNINNSPVIRCPVADCTYQTTYQLGLRMHSLTHQTEKPFKCEQNGCNKTFKTAVLLRWHKNNRHLKNRPFVCDYNGCERSFEIRDQLRRHQKSHTKRFQCEFVNCSKSYKQKPDLNRHIREKH